MSNDALANVLMASGFHKVVILSDGELLFHALVSVRVSSSCRRMRENGTLKILEREGEFGVNTYSACKG